MILYVKEFLICNLLILFYCIVNIFLEFNNCKFCNEVCEKVVEEILWFGIE